MKGVVGSLARETALTAPDPQAALIPHGVIADAGVVVTGGLLVAEAHRHGEVGVGHLGVAYRTGAGGEQAANPEVPFGVAGAGCDTIKGDGLLQMALVLGCLALFERSQRLGGLSEIPALCHRLRHNCQQQRQKSSKNSPFSLMFLMGYLLFRYRRYRGTWLLSPRIQWILLL